MILKSLSRKGGSGAFAQLYDYITQRAEPERIWHNIDFHQPDREITLEEFYRNATHIKHTPRHNICYHEVLSVKREPSRGKDYEERQVEALRDLTQQYLSARAKEQLAYAAVHLDQSETIHVHMMISSNGRDCDRRVRLAKHEFLDIQKNLEKQLQERYPELEEKAIYNKPWEQSQNLSDREQAMKNRTGQPSRKDLMRDTLEQVFARAKTPGEAQQVLSQYGIELTQRGKNITASRDTIKCRLKTLGLDEAYQNIGKEVKTPKQEQPEARSPDDELEKFWKSKERERDEGRELER